MSASRPAGRIKSLLHWLVRLCGWLWRPFPRGIYCVLLPIVAVALVVMCLSAAEPAIRSAGLVLQILGIGSVIVGIEKTREMFKHPTLGSIARKWLAVRPRLGPATITATMDAAVLTALGARARAYVSSDPPAGASTNDRLDSLERNVGLIHSRISSVQDEMDALERKQADSLQHEQQARTLADDQLSDKLSGLATGGFSISLAGAVWLFVGVTMSTLSPELSRWLG